MSGSAGRIWGLVYRHLALYRGSWPRLLELAYWPVLQMCIWEFTSSYFAGRLAGGGPVSLVAALLGGVLLWEITLRTQMGMSATFLEELWSRNLGHVFVSPLRPWEMMAALTVMSVLRMLAGVLPAVLLAWALYWFDLFAIGAPLVLFVAALMVMGWCVGLGVMSLILRHGLGAEALAWSVTFGLAPLSCVFYPVSALPYLLRPLALSLPSTHVFEGLRAVMVQGVVRWDQGGWAFGLDGFWLLAALLLFSSQFQFARMRGALLSVGE